MKVASSALPSSAIIFFLIVVADLRGLFTNKCMMYTSTTMITPVFLDHYSIEMHFYMFTLILFSSVCICFAVFLSHEQLGKSVQPCPAPSPFGQHLLSITVQLAHHCELYNAEIQSG